MNQVYHAKLNDEYRLIIPAPCRKQLGLQPGQELLIQVTDSGLELTTFDLALKRFQDRVRELVPDDVSLVDELIAERRAEAEKEASE